MDEDNAEIEHLQEVCNRLREGVEIKDRRYRLKSYKKCFVGSEALTWLVDNQVCHTREDAIGLCNLMIQAGMMAHVLREHEMQDSFLFYRFIEDEDHGNTKTWLDGNPVSWGDFLSSFFPASGADGADDDTTDHLVGRTSDSESQTSESFSLAPLDKHNVELLDKVHPADWQNPNPAPLYDLVVIGAGAGGLVSAAGAAGVGAKVAIIEMNLLGGDCLNVGCVPSKALLHSANLASTLRKATMEQAKNNGVYIEGTVCVDFPQIMARMRQLRAKIADNDSASRFAQKLGIDVFLGRGQFTSKNTITVIPSQAGFKDGKWLQPAESDEGSDENSTPVTLKFVRAIIATGGSPCLPNIPGLAEVHGRDFELGASRILTNENLFNLTELPARMGVIGAGPIGVEMAQAFQRLGSQVTLFARSGRILNKEEVDAASIVEDALREDGVTLHLNVGKYLEVAEVNESCIMVQIEQKKDSVKETFEFDCLLVAAGRKPNVSGLGLESASIEYDDRSGVVVSKKLQTSNSSVFAVGDVCSPVQFTHASDFMARMAVRNALFFGKDSFSNLLIPWCTYCSPEIARVGASQQDLEANDTSFTIFEKKFEDNDRAILEDSTQGFVRFLCKKNSDAILGATIVGSHAGDMIGEITMAMQNKIGLSKLASVIHPYPTLAEAIRQCGDLYNRTRLTNLVRGMLRTVLRVQRTGKSKLS